jgi:WD40 repeat protein
VGTSAGTVAVWEVQTSRLIHNMRTDSSQEILALAYQPDATAIITGYADGNIIVWYTDRRQYRILDGLNWLTRVVPSVQRFLGKSIETKAHASAVRGLAICSDGKRFVSASDDHFLKLWDMSSCNLIQILPNDTWVASVAAHPKRPLIAAGCGDDTIAIWDTQTESRMLRLLEPTTEEQVRHLDSSGDTPKDNAHMRGIRSLAFDPEGKLLASGCTDGSITIWDTTRWIVLRKLVGHQSIVYGLSFSKSRPLLASCSYDGTIKLWNPWTGEIMRSLQGNQGYVRSIDLARRDALLASCGEDSRVNIWRAEAFIGFDMLAFAEVTASRNLRPREFTRFFGVGVPYRSTFKQLPQPVDIDEKERVSENFLAR